MAGSPELPGGGYGVQKIMESSGNCGKMGDGDRYTREAGTARDRAEQVGGYPKEEDPTLTYPKDVLSWRRNWLEVKLDAGKVPLGDFPGCTDVESREGGSGTPLPFWSLLPLAGSSRCNATVLAHLEGLTTSCNLAQPRESSQLGRAHWLPRTSFSRDPFSLLPLPSASE